jgi:hypothetical protein
MITGAMSQLSSAREAEKRWRCNYVDSSVVGYSPGSHDVSTEAEKSPLLRAVYQATTCEDTGGWTRLDV